MKEMFVKIKQAKDKGWLVLAPAAWSILTLSALDMFVSVSTPVAILGMSGGIIGGAVIKTRLDKVTNKQLENLQTEVSQLEKNQQPRKPKRIYHSKSRSQTKEIMNKVAAKSLDETHARAEHYEKWIRANYTYYHKNPLAVIPTINALNQSDLMTLSAVANKFPDDNVCKTFAKEIEQIIPKGRNTNSLRTARQ